MPYPSRALEPLGSKLLPGLDKCCNLFHGIRPSPSWLRLQPSSSQRRLAAAALLDQSFSNSKSLLAIRPILKKHSEKASAIAPGKLDEWMNESICEIVKSIGEAPFLLHIFSAGGGDGEGDQTGSSSLSASSDSLRLEKEPALADRWPHITRKWGEGKPIPDGIVLVEEIEAAGEMEVRGDGANGIRTWGLLIQGRGMDCASCYLLKTCRVRGPAGFCTHFNLVKAKCFGDPAEAQIRKAWLAGG